MTKLSITGSDNKTDISFIQQLVKTNQEIELGLLYFLEKQGTVRNPDYACRAEIMKKIPKDRLSMHLCGDEIFRIILDDNYKDNIYYKELEGVNRIQLNINARRTNFSHNEIVKIYSRLLDNGYNIIIQYHEKSKEWILPFLNEKASLYRPEQLNILLDSSLGRGIVADIFEIPKELQNYIHLNFGFAGGLNPENISEIHDKVKRLNVKFWLDLESGARTNNELDKEKVLALENAVFD